ncbi:hypothetical protein NLG97_g3437 [Lecanicillium saksenae]|uniref:Uncharacterized protein n=1 Tax=Lecanicillium saksenae TaxID=468837 RepID=A0ACC1QZB2_9HYPO|nr:hypothetical protein NLG97_g3437 [Lecanicillium saksenae]
MLVRVWAKVNVKRWGSDDWFVTAAYLVSTMDVGASFWAAQHGYGLTLSRVPQAVQGQIAKALFAQQQFYIVAMALCKISAALFLIRLSTSKSHTRPGFAVVALTLIWGVASMFVVGLRGKLDSPWATMDGSWDMHVRWIAVEIIGIIIELLIFAIAFLLVRGIQISWAKRSVILAAFAVRLILIPIMIARLYYLAPEFNSDPTLTNIVPHITTEIALHFSVISASITSLRPFLRTFHLDYTIGSSGNSKYAARSGNHSGTRSRNQSRPRSYVRLQSVGKGGTGKQNSKATVSKSRQDSWEMPAAAYTTSTNDVERQQPEQFGRAGSQDHLVPNGAESGLVIQKTVDWSIQYEDNKKKAE